MTTPQRRSPSQRPNAARDRIAAKRAARRTRSLRPMRLFILIIGVIAIVLLAVLLRFRGTIGSIQQNDPRQALAATTAQAGSAAANHSAASTALNTPFNLLLIGVDKRPNADDGVRSDTLIVVHVEPQAHWASLLSIPRDSVVTIPKFGQAKINTAYSDGYNNAEDLYGASTTPDAAGGAFAAETVEQFLGITVDYVAQVDFAGFAQLVDALGGVPIDVAQPLLDAAYPTEDYGVERIYIPAGLQVMDGATALKYARSRHSSDDFGRGKRQQQVLKALLTQVRTRGLLENVGTINQWVDVLATNVRTTLPLHDPAAIAALVSLAHDLTPERIVQLSINPNDVEVTLNGSDLYWNQADLEVVLARWQAGPQTASPTTNTVPQAVQLQVINAAGIEGLATKLTNALRAKGYTLIDPTTAAQTTPATQIIHYRQQTDLARSLATALGLPDTAIQQGDQASAPSGADVVLVIGQDYRAEWAAP